MTAERVRELRKDLESRNFKGPKAFMKRLLDEHRRLAGQVPTSCAVSIRGTPFLSGFNRVVIGAHGPYIEFEDHHCLLALRTKQGQEWRETEGSPKYLWLYPCGFPDIKVYKQLRPVEYASYVVDKYYIDLLAVELG
jgi:hypothetical protein